MSQLWFKWFERDYTVQYWEILAYASRNVMAQYFPSATGTVAIYRYQPRNAAMFATAKEAEQLRKNLLKHFSNVENSKKFLANFVEIGKSYVETAKKASALAPSNARKAYELYWNSWIELTNVLRLTFELNEVFADNLFELIEKKYNLTKPSTPLAEILATCLKPSKVAAPVQAGIDAWRVKQNYSESAVEKFRKKYEWFPCMDLQFEPLTIKGAEEMVQNALVPPEEHKEVNVAKILKLSKEEAEFLKIAREFFHVKDLRDEFRRKGVFYALPLFKQISRELSISYAQVCSLLHEEIKRGLQDEEVNAGEASKRLKEHYFLWLEVNSPAPVQSLAQSKADEKAAEFSVNAKEDLSTLNRFKGIPAAPGICKGKVRKVKVAAHLDRVQPGEVLVAVTTNPNYMTAMNLACAIVTDEGGVTSHAAIVSREMKKPCVVGAKIATKVLADGDLVEVNGSTGEVRKIE